MGGENDVGLGTRMVFGAVGGMGASCFCHPLDVIRVQMQIGAAGSSPLGAAREIVRGSGVAGLYNGLSAAFLRQWTYGACRLGIFSYLQSEAKKKGDVSFGTKLGIGMLSGAIGSFVGVPSELALVRMSADSKLAPAFRRNYSNVVECCYRIIKEEGILGLWRGSAITIVRASSLSSANLAVASECMVKLPQYGFPQVPEWIPLGPTFLSDQASYFIAAFAATTVSQPFDVVKSRLQNMPIPKGGGAPMYNGMVQCAMLSVKESGPMVLYRGFLPSFIKLVPYNLIQLTLVQEISKFFTGKGAL